ncbi:ribonuclease P protein subunit RPR2 [Blastomyces parvus]|uniref:Ribonuclease P protein subunit RPR2 n=1 Tax=Blastomyces parvus TaxID=2060905 RepID=A0A2B7XFP2_9EURO|nr:ribonuclease P protein subunit RPR2 [Blastomyces parvus]
MAKAKTPKGPGGAGQNHIQARVAFLYRASTYLQSASVSNHSEASNHGSPTQIQVQGGESATNDNKTSDIDATRELKQPPPKQHVQVSKLSRYLASQLRGVSLKSQLRLSRDIKRSICKRCDSLLIPNSTCMETVENASRGGSEKKPWADVRVVRCNSCGYMKRYPQTEKRSLKLAERKRPKEVGDGGQTVTSQPTMTQLPAVHDAR